MGYVAHLRECRRCAFVQVWLLRGSGYVDSARLRRVLAHQRQWL